MAGMLQLEDGLNRNADILRRVIDVNGKIREVLNEASAIRLSAMNASLMARRAGARTKGFAVVSTELRAFSHRLEGGMQELGTQIALLVRAAAEVRKKERERRCFERCRSMAAGKAGLLDDACGRMQTERLRLHETVSENWLRLGKCIRQVMKACGIGVALTCSAKIEAVHGQEFAADLAQVAHSIEDAMSSITLTMNQLSELALDQAKA